MSEEVTTITIPKVRQGSGVRMTVALLDNGVRVDWSSLTDIMAFIYSDAQKVIAGPCTAVIDETDSEKLICTYDADAPQYLGINSLVIRCKYLERKKTYDAKVLEFVSRTEDLSGEAIVLEDPDLAVTISVEEVSTSLLDDAIAAAIDAAAAAQAAAVVAEADHGIAVDDHTRAESDHSTAADDHTRAEGDHSTAADDHTRAESDHSTAADDHTRAEGDHGTAADDHTRAEGDHTTAASDHTQAGEDHTRAESDHGTAADDHTQAASDHTTAASDHSTAADDHTQAGTDHSRAEDDHTTAASDHTIAQSDHQTWAGYRIVVNSIGETAPETPASGDRWYKTTDNKVYTYTDSWDSGVAATVGATVVNSTTNDVFYYNGSGLVPIGGKFATGEDVEDVGIDATPTGGSNNLVKSGGVAASLKNRNVAFSDTGQRLKPDGDTGNAPTFSTTDYIKVTEGEVYLYKGYTANNFPIAVGYDAAKENPVILQNGGGTKTIQFTIPSGSGVAYMRVCAANNTHASYTESYLWHLSLESVDVFKSGELVNDKELTNIISPDNNLPTNAGILATIKGLSCDFDFMEALNTSGVAVPNSNYRCTDYIPVDEADIVCYSGHGNSSYPCIFGYDANKENARVILSGSSAAYANKYLNIPSGVAYIRAASNASYTYSLRVLSAGAVKDVTERQLQATGMGDSIDLPDYGKLNADGTVDSATTNVSVSKFLRVNTGDVVNIYGCFPTAISASLLTIAGYDAEKEDAFVRSLLSPAEPYGQYSVTIPADVKYIRVSLAASTYAGYTPSCCRIIHKYNYPEVKSDIAAINSVLYKTEDTYINVTGTANTATGPKWSREIKGAGEYRINSTTAPTSIALYTSRSSDRELVRTLTDGIVYLGDKTYQFFVTDADISDGGKFLQIVGITIESAEDPNRLYKHTETNVINEMLDTFKGKNIAVIGDSISTDKDMNPYYVIQDSDVGNEIQSYITYYDVHPQGGGEATVIDGVALTDDDIGTLKTLTPAAADVGKKLGVAPYYFGYGWSWPTQLCKRLGANLINASYSGAALSSGQRAETPEYLLSYGWSDYTIGRCRKRNEDGTYTDPDVIIIYRGTNDFSHGVVHAQEGYDYATLDSDYDLTANGYPNDDKYDEVDGKIKCGYYRAYYLTIKKLRAAYPNAMIYCCTLNAFKRVTYDRFPTRNGQYSLPDMNNAIRDIANKMGCGLIEFDKDGITFENCSQYAYDSGAAATTPTHPNKEGHTIMAHKAYNDMKDLILTD